jgi:4-alpha-glucanotransferase
MSGHDLRRLAAMAGVDVEWTDQNGVDHTVSPDVLRSVLDALGFPCRTPPQIRESLKHLAAHEDEAPQLLVGVVGDPLVLPFLPKATRALLSLEEGRGRVVDLASTDNGRIVLPAIEDPGYHRLQVDSREVGLAIAPRTCHRIEDCAEGKRLWGLVAQVYGLRRAGDCGIGDLGAVSTLATAAARHGASAVALSPLHALFSADPSRFGPYSPSNRLFFNPLHADPGLVFSPGRVANAMANSGIGDSCRRLDALHLIDWRSAGEAKLKLLRELFAFFLTADAGTPLDADFQSFVAAQGTRLEEHARFEALHAMHLGKDPPQWLWRDWPAGLRRPDSPEVEAFAHQNPFEIGFHKFLQWLVDRALAAAQGTAREAGMAIGLISDIAVGLDRNGSHAWSRPDELLAGLTVGSPPDAFNPDGQNWGLTTFSPRALVQQGYEPFIATLRAAMRHAGGVRIDHVMGLMRLWLIPDGAARGEGAYVRYPLDALLRLIALESRRHRAVVIGEDLGTVPAGFRKRLAEVGIAGMSVLWFQRDERGFLPPAQWPSTSVAMTTTHDLPTVVGWWRGSDIEARKAAGRPAPDPNAEAAERTHDRKQLGAAFAKAGIGEIADAARDDDEQALAAALRFVAGTPAALALIPLEDALGLDQQPNLPGTIDEHPNWRRRLPAAAEQILDAPPVTKRLAAVAKARSGR